MRSLNLHLKILIAVLVVLGISVTAYQIFVLGIPVTEDATDDLWNIDAKVEFVASAKDPVKIQMFVPPLSRDFVSLNESFISNNYGVSVNRLDGNRKVTWSARRAKGNQTLYYRLVLTKRYSGEKVKIKGPTFRDSIAVEGPEKIAAEALLAVGLHHHLLDLHARWCAECRLCRQDGQVKAGHTAGLPPLLRTPTCTSLSARPCATFATKTSSSSALAELFTTYVILSFYLTLVLLTLATAVPQRLGQHHSLP